MKELTSYEENGYLVRTFRFTSKEKAETFFKNYVPDEGRSSAIYAPQQGNIPGPWKKYSWYVELKIKL